MQFTAILSALSLAMVASALPNPTTPTGPTCDAGGEVACCDSVDNKGVGINCFASTLPILDTVCLGGQSIACCSPSSDGSLVNVQCLSINV